MRKLIFVVICFAITFSVSSQSIKMPPPSPPQTIKQDFGISSIELSYSRPGVKGRKVFGDLVPYGAVWRTGANSATTIDFAGDVTIGTTKVPAGKYGLLTIPDKDNWTIIITKQLDVTNPADYKQESDVVRVNVKPMTLKDKMETFTMQFANVKPSTCDLQMMWENTAVAMPISSDVETVVMKEIDEAMNKDNRPYFQSALYYLNNGKDLNQAIAWFDKAITQQPDGYWIYHQKANALAKLGKKDEAKATAQKSIELAKEAKNDDYVRLNEKLLEQLK
ncbi:MAG TPA: DUF2911 domain-containing protein, partial [Chitinophagaceae bacterium]|jgi:DUF2911 family protein/tetratricopeptide repeat protein|nr:DUF2911 domain-containing protein [Chitinophagaceae bacterium]